MSSAKRCHLSLKVVILSVIAFCLAGCESGSLGSELSRNDGEKSQNGRELAVTQTRTTDDGATEMAIAFMPTAPGLPRFNLNHLKGQDLFSLGENSDGVRARGGAEAVAVRRYPRHSLGFAKGSHALDPRQFSVSLTHPAYDIVPPNPNTNPPIPGNLDEERIGYTSSTFMAFHVELDSMVGNHRATIGNGIVTANLEIIRNLEDSPPIPLTTTVKLNGQTVAFYSDDSKHVERVVLFLPLECGVFKELDVETMSSYVGRWTITSTPKFTRRIIWRDANNEFVEEDAPITPLNFEIKALVLDEFETEVRDPVPPATEDEEPKSNGAVYSFKPKLLGKASAKVDSYEDGTLCWRAQIKDEDGQIVRGYFYGTGPNPSSDARIEIDWDGTTDGGTRVSANKKYVLHVKALVSDRDDIAEIEGRFGALTTLREYRSSPPVTGGIEITPNPYIPPERPDGPFTYRGGWLCTEDLDGNVINCDFPETVVDEYGDTIQVDEDGDGIPDYAPEDLGLPAPGITFKASLRRPGYKVTYPVMLTVTAENGQELHSTPLNRQGTRDEIDYNWNPILDPAFPGDPFTLEPQLLIAEIRYESCLDDEVHATGLRVLSRGTSDEPVLPGCDPCVAVGEVAISKNVTVDSVRFEGSDGPYPVFDWRKNEIRGKLSDASDAQYKFRRENIPIVFKVGTSSVRILGQLQSFVFSGPLTSFDTVRVRLLGSWNGENKFEIGEKILTRSQFFSPNFHGGALSFDFSPDFNTVARNSLELFWDIELLDSAGLSLSNDEVSTPTEANQSHQFYSVLDERIDIDFKGITVFEQPDEEPWYDNRTFQADKEEAKKLSSTSPLDQAVILAEGARTPEEAIGSVVRRFYLESGATYTSSTNASVKTGVNGNGIYLKWYLEEIVSKQGPLIECPQTATYAQLLLGFIGVETEVLDINPGGSDSDALVAPKIWTNYVRAIQPADPGKTVRLVYNAIHLPTIAGFVTRNQQVTPLYPGRGGYFPEWTQIRWDFHQVLLGSIGGQSRIFDCSLRFDKQLTAGDSALINPNFLLNQRNINDGFQPRLEKPILEEIVDRIAAVNIPPFSDLAANSSTDYASYRKSIGKTPQIDNDVFGSGMSNNDYLDRLLYLKVRPDLQSKHGYKARVVLDSGRETILLRGRALPEPKEN